MKESTVATFYKELAARQREEVVSLHAEASRIVDAFGRIVGSAGRQEAVATIYFGETRYQICKSLGRVDAPIRIVTGGAEMLQTVPQIDLEESNQGPGFQEVARLCVTNGDIGGSRVGGRDIVPDAYVIGLHGVAMIVNLWSDLLSATSRS